MFKNILIAYDGSEHARKAVELAANLVREQGSQSCLWIVTVMEEPGHELGEPYLSKLIEERTIAGQALLTEATELAKDGVDLHTDLLFGAPADCILQAAQTCECDLIVMGTRGHSSLQEVLVGSQAQKVVSNAPCPVLMVK
ncbi:MAG TPA: universal stress protein [Anaerolineaceae bacterium]|nr:universal stress protein [Anaerolineaceae bacterium]